MQPKEVAAPEMAKTSLMDSPAPHIPRFDVNNTRYRYFETIFTQTCHGQTAKGHQKVGQFKIPSSGKKALIVNHISKRCHGYPEYKFILDAIGTILSSCLLVQ